MALWPSVGDGFFVKRLKRALWPSVGDGGKYGHVLFIKILISWRILEGQMAKTSHLASHRLEMTLIRSLSSHIFDTKFYNINT